MKLKRIPSFTYHYRGHTGEFKWNETYGYYVCDYEDAANGKYIYTLGCNRFECLLNWMKAVNNIIHFTQTGEASLYDYP